MPEAILPRLLRRLETRLPPPLLALLLAGAATWLHGGVPARDQAATLQIAASLGLALLGVACDLSGLLAFRQAHTTINPLHPERSAVLVTGGIYRLTRNPMYIGLNLLLAAWAVWLGSLWAALMLPLGMAYLTRFQIQPEEAILREKFGSAYVDYCRRVRRWL